jgi:hypothetical protein
MSLSVLALLLTCAALDGPVVRYRYPTDPLVALMAASALTIGLPWLYRRVALLRGGPGVAREHRAASAPAAGSAPATGPASRGA